MVKLVWSFRVDTGQSAMYCDWLIVEKTVKTNFVGITKIEDPERGDKILLLGSCWKVHFVASVIGILVLY